MPEKKKVLIGAPNSGRIDREVTEFLLSTVNKFSTIVQLAANLNDAAPVDNNRNLIVDEFLEGDFDALLFVDSDNPPTRNPLDLLDRDLDILACPTPVWKHRIYERGLGHCPIIWNIFAKVGAKQWRSLSPSEGSGTGLVEVDAAGTGCMLIQRRVLEAVQPAFHREWNQNGTVAVSSDILFCDRAKENGFKVWASRDHLCRHFKRIDLLAVARTLAVRDVGALSRLSANPNTRQYWDEQWSQRPGRTYPYHQWIAARVQELGAQSVIDFGAGAGDALVAIRSRCGDDVKLCGVDHSERAVERMRNRGIDAVRAEVERFGTLDRHDVVLCLQTLEHIDDDVAWLRQLLSCGKTVIVAVPNDCLPPGLEPEHRRVYTQESLIERAKTAGATDLRLHVWEDYLVLEARDASQPQPCGDIEAHVPLPEGGSFPEAVL